MNLLRRVCAGVVGVASAALWAGVAAGQGPASLDGLTLRVLPVEAAKGAFLSESGAPVPEGTPLERLRLEDASGAAVPARIQPLGGSGRWAFVAFVTRPGVGEYRLRLADPGAPGPGFPRLAVSEDKGRVVVDTGAARFELDAASFRPFTRVTVAGKSAALDPGRGGLSLQGRFFSSKALAVIEERGPVYARIAYKGKLLDATGAEGCSFSARLTFAAGQAWARMEVTLSQDTEEVFLDLEEYALELKTPAVRSAAFYPSEEAAAVTAQAFPAVLLQSGKKRINDQWAYPWTLRAPGVEERRGERARGAAVLKLDGGLTAEVAITDWWQNGPASLEVLADGARLCLYPKTGETLPLHVGMAKTHRVFVAFSAEGEGALSASAGAFLAKARALPAPGWYAAMGEPVALAPRRPDRFAGLEQLMDEWIEDRFVFGREAYGEYGWLDFGDFRLGSEEAYWNNNETMVDHGLFIQFARTGDKRYLDWGEETVRHYQDIDVRHHLPARKFDYAILMGPGVDRETARQWGEKEAKERKEKFVYFGASLSPHATYTHGFYHYGQKQSGLYQGKYYSGGAMNHGHCFMPGHVTHYLMTGDRRSLEVAEEVAGALLKDFWYETTDRATGTPALFLLEMHAATRDRRYLDRAGQAIEYWLKHPDEKPGYLYVVSRAIARYAALAGDEKAKQFFLSRLDEYIKAFYTASDGARTGIVVQAQRHGDHRYFTQLGDLADAAAFTGKPEYLRLGAPFLEVLVENHAFDSTALSFAPPYMAACERMGVAASAPRLPQRFTLRYPDTKILHARKEVGKPLEIRLYTDAGFRAPADIQVKGRVALLSPTGALVREEPVQHAGFHVYTFALDAEAAAGDYRIEASGAYDMKGRATQLLWDAWSSNGKLVAEITKDFMPVDQSSLYFEAPKGCAGFTIGLSPMLKSDLNTLAWRLYDPAGRLHEARVFPGNSATLREIKVSPLPAGGQGLWRLRLPFGKNFVRVEGLAPYCSVTREGYFRPEKGGGESRR